MAPQPDNLYARSTEREILTAEDRRQKTLQTGVLKDFLKPAALFAPLLMFATPVTLALAAAAAMALQAVFFFHEKTTTRAELLEGDKRIAEIFQETAQEFAAAMGTKTLKLRWARITAAGQADIDGISFNITKLRKLYERYGDGEAFRTIVQHTFGHEATHYHNRDPHRRGALNSIEVFSWFSAICNITELGFHAASFGLEKLAENTPSITGIAEPGKAVLVNGIAAIAFRFLSNEAGFAKAQEETTEFRADLGAARAFGLAQQIEALVLMAAAAKEELSRQKFPPPSASGYVGTFTPVVHDAAAEWQAIKAVKNPLAKLPRVDGLMRDLEKYRPLWRDGFYPHDTRKLHYLLGVYKAVLEKEAFPARQSLPARAAALAVAAV